jgi:hypothetical protein
MRHFKIIGAAPVLVTLAMTLAFGGVAAPPASATCRPVYARVEARFRLLNTATGECMSGGGGLFGSNILQYSNVELGSGTVFAGVYECAKVVAGETGYWNNTACTVPGNRASERLYVWIVRGSKGGASWEQCVEGKEKEAPTKYTSDECREAAKSNEGKWQWDEATEKEKIKGVGFTLTLTDTKTAVGVSKIRCTKGLEATGGLGPGGNGEIETAEVASPKTNCKSVEGGCTEVEKVKGLHLTWGLYWSDKEKPVMRIQNGGSGNPGWEITCNTILGKKTDSCESEGTEKEMPSEGTEKSETEKPEYAALEDVLSSGVLLVTATYINTHKGKCTEGGVGSGEAEWEVALLDKSGNGLRE